MLSATRLSFFAVIALLAGCADTGSSRPPAPSAPVPVAVPAAPGPVAGLPIDQPCLPTSHGCIALNPDVTEATIDQTICVAGYTASVRPATSYTNGVKAKLLREEGIDESHLSDYELDHIIPLALGGSPRKLSNLQLQPWTGEDSAKAKDGLERRLQLLVCGRRMTLIDAQSCIAENWQACAARVGATVSAGRPGTAVGGDPRGTVAALPAPPPPSGCLIKGNISSNGRIYHVPGSPSYDATKIDESKGEKWFCTVQEAEAAGWRAPKN
jgi:hypothetical protein